LIRGQDAKNYPLGIREVEDFSRLKAMYGLENDPTLLEPGWVDTLVDALAHPGVRILLLVIGFVALYAELHSPGIGVAAFVALVCFILFFWSQFLGGTAGWLEVVLFVAGLACLLLEIFVLPGFGIFGLGGGVMILASLILASQTFIIPHNAYEMAEFQTSLFTVGSAIVGIIAAIALLNRWLPQTPVLGRMVLQPPSEEEAEAISESESLTHFENLLGRQGTATTPLVPGGKARFGKEVYDVMTDGQFVPRNAAVEVVELRGNWIVVRPIEETA
jgi:membrane-bound serine protease (ClpP class)